MKRAWVALIVVGVIGCKDKTKEAPPTPAAAKGSAVAPVPADKPKIQGPSITPVITNSITFFVPKDAPWWGEMTFGCYAAAVTLQPGNRPSEAFTKVSPLIEPALRMADIDLDKDLHAIGMWGCGEGPCFYLAVELRDPDKLKTLLSSMVPGKQPKELGKHHWTLEAPGAQGSRNIGVRAVPINWPAKLPTDTWSAQAAKSTHVIFLTGMFDKTTEVDALASAVDDKAAAARVIEAESLVGDARGRCVLGHVTKRPFQPGYELERARFVLAAPEGKSDPMTQLLASNRTLDLEVELTLNPAPTEKVVAAWIAKARKWLGDIGDSVRAGYADQGALVDAMYAAVGLIGKSGFRHTIHDNHLTLSFRTDRITSREIATVESKLEAVLGPQP